MESKLQAENQEMTEQLNELRGRFDNVVADNLNKAAQITKLRQQASDLAKEVDRLAAMILDKQEKS